MGVYCPKATTRPTVTKETWTKVNTLSGSERRYLLLVNEDETNVWRFEMVARGVAAPTLATHGRVLVKAPAGCMGGTYEETADNRALADCYVYQGSAGDLATLAVVEGG